MDTTRGCDDAHPISETALCEDACGKKVDGPTEPDCLASTAGPEVHDVRKPAIVTGWGATKVHVRLAQELRRERLQKPSEGEGRIDGSSIEIHQLQIRSRAAHI